MLSAAAGVCCEKKREGFSVREKRVRVLLISLFEFAESTKAHRFRPWLEQIYSDGAQVQAEKKVQVDVHSAAALGVKDVFSSI